MGSYEAATHCASLVAAQRVTEQQRQQQQLQHQQQAMSAAMAAMGNMPGDRAHMYPSVRPVPYALPCVMPVGGGGSQGLVPVPTSFGWVPV